MQCPLCPELQHGTNCVATCCLRTAQVYSEGRMSRHLDNLALGDTMWFKGPKGRFNYVPNMKQRIGASMQLPGHAWLSPAICRETACQVLSSSAPLGWPGADGESVNQGHKGRFNDVPSVTQRSDARAFHMLLTMW